MGPTRLRRHRLRTSWLQPNWKREEADVLYTRQTYLFDRQFHVGVRSTSIDHEIDPVFRTTTDSISYLLCQLFGTNSAVAKVQFSITRYGHAHGIFPDRARQEPRIRALEQVYARPV